MEADHASGVVCISILMAWRGVKLLQLRDVLEVTCDKQQRGVVLDKDKLSYWIRSFILQHKTSKGRTLWVTGHQMP